jgi:hypothetical protein
MRRKRNNFDFTDITLDFDPDDYPDMDGKFEE